MITRSTPAPEPGSRRDEFALRPLRGFTPLIWFIGLAAGLALTWEPLLHHVDYIKRFGDLAHRILWTGLGALVVALPLYQWIRGRGWWRYELLALAAWPVTFGLVRDPLATLTVLWMLTGCFLAGSYLLDKLDLSVEGAAESLALSVAAGMGVLVAVLFVLGSPALTTAGCSLCCSPFLVCAGPHACGVSAPFSAGSSGRGGTAANSAGPSMACWSSSLSCS
jgi:hypothetical protein